MGKRGLEIRYCRYVSDAKESLVVKGTNYTMFVPDLNAEVNLAVSALMQRVIGMVLKRIFNNFITLHIKVTYFVHCNDFSLECRVRKIAHTF